MVVEVSKVETTVGGSSGRLLRVLRTAANGVAARARAPAAILLSTGYSGSVPCSAVGRSVE